MGIVLVIETAIMKPLKHAILGILVLMSCNTMLLAQAMNFGAYSYITVGTVLQSNQSYTKEAWIKVYPTKATHGRNIISAYDHPFWLENGKLCAANGYGRMPHLVTVTDSKPLPLKVWVHVAVTYDAVNTTMKLYRNDTLVATDTHATGYSQSKIQIGASESGDFADGVDIDEVRIWTVALTQEQIKTNMNQEVAAQNDLIVYYKFNEGTARANNSNIHTVKDYSGMCFNGMLTNFGMKGNTANYVKGYIAPAIADATKATAAYSLK